MTTDQELYEAHSAALAGPDRKTRERIREAFQSNYRAVLNLLASMTPAERLKMLHEISPGHYAEREALSVVEDTWGIKAVQIALGKAG